MDNTLLDGTFLRLSRGPCRLPYDREKTCLPMRACYMRNSRKAVVYVVNREVKGALVPHLILGLLPKHPEYLQQAIVLMEYRLDSGYAVQVYAERARMFPLWQQKRLCAEKAFMQAIHEAACCFLGCSSS